LRKTGTQDREMTLRDRILMYLLEKKGGASA